MLGLIDPIHKDPISFPRHSVSFPWPKFHWMANFNVSLSMQDRFEQSITSEPDLALKFATFPGDMQILHIREKREKNIKINSIPHKIS